MQEDRPQQSGRQRIEGTEAARPLRAHKTLGHRLQGKSISQLVDEKLASDRSGTLDYEGALDEVVADGCEMMLKRSRVVETMARENRGLFDRIHDWLQRWASRIKEAFAGVEAYHEEAKAMLDYMDQLQRIWDRALERAARNAAEIGQDTKTAAEDGGRVQYSFVGERLDGIEVYETSTEVKALRWGERRRRFMELMENQYRGRTARFVKDGESLYARFAPEDIKKNIYGDMRSDDAGKDAKINAGADGDIFDLVENASYDHSEDERGKTGKAHRGIESWDYFVKKVQIDGKVFDLLANVRKSNDAEYVYSLQLNEDKSTEAAPPDRSVGDQSLNGALTASNNSILSSSEKSNNKIMDQKIEAEAERKSKTQMQERDFAPTERELLLEAATKRKAAPELKEYSKKAEFSLVASAYGRSETNIRNLINNSELLYLDPNKNKTDTWLMHLRVQFPSGQSLYGPVGTIS